MVDKYDAMIDSVAGESKSSGDKYDQMIDAVAQPQSSGLGLRETGEISGDTPAMPGPLSDFSEGFLARNPEGFLQKAGAAFPAIAGGIIAGPPGAATAESLRQAAMSGNAVATGQQPPSPLSVIGNVALAGATQHAGDLAAPYLGRATGATAGKFGEAARGTLKYLGINLAGVKAPSYAVAEEAPQLVRKYVGAAPEVGDKLAEDVRSVIGTAVRDAEQSYPRLIEAAKANPAYAGKTIDLASRVGDKALQIADDFGFQSTPGLKAPPEASRYWNFAKQVDGLKSASIDAVYQFQKQLNNLARANAGKPLGAAFGKLQSAVKDVLGAEIPEIGQANAQYAAAKALEEQTGKLTSANDLLDYVRRAYSGAQSNLGREAIEKAAASVPGLGNLIDNINAYGAAKDFTPLMRSLPQTGFGADLVKYATGGVAVGGAGAALNNPVAAAGGAALAGTLGVITSPRAALLALRGAQRAGPALRYGTEAAATALTPALAQTFAHMSAGSIENYYRSPGNK